MRERKVGTLNSIRYRIPRIQAYGCAQADIDYLFVFPALKRSGHHAIIDWILTQFEGVRAHYNYGNKYASEVFLNRCDDFWTSCRNPLRGSSLRAVGINFENYPLSTPDDLLALLDECSVAFPNAKRKFLVLVVRDAYNNFASCVARRPGSWSTALWEDYARLYLEGDSLQWDGFSFLPIGYNQWCSGLEERRIIAERIGVDRFLGTQERVSHFGYGSSFEKLQFDGQASEMKVLERWKHLPAHLLQEMCDQLGESTHSLNRSIMGAEFVDTILDALREYSLDRGAGNDGQP